MKRFALILVPMLMIASGCETLRQLSLPTLAGERTAPPKTMMCPAKVGPWIESDNGDGTYTVTDEGLADVSVYIDMLERALGCEVE